MDPLPKTKSRQIVWGEEPTAAKTSTPTTPPKADKPAPDAAIADGHRGSTATTMPEAGKDSMPSATPAKVKLDPTPETPTPSTSFFARCCTCFKPTAKASDKKEALLAGQRHDHEESPSSPRIV